MALATPTIDRTLTLDDISTPMGNSTIVLPTPRLDINDSIIENPLTISELQGASSTADLDLDDEKPPATAWWGFLKGHKDEFWWRLALAQWWKGKSEREKKQWWREWRHKRRRRNEKLCRVGQTITRIMSPEFCSLTMSRRTAIPSYIRAAPGTDKENMSDMDGLDGPTQILDSPIRIPTKLHPATSSSALRGYTSRNRSRFFSEENADDNVDTHNRAQPESRIPSDENSNPNANAVGANSFRTNGAPNNGSLFQSVADRAACSLRAIDRLQVTIEADAARHDEEAAVLSRIDQALDAALWEHMSETQRMVEQMEVDFREAANEVEQAEALKAQAQGRETHFLAETQRLREALEDANAARRTLEHDREQEKSLIRRAVEEELEEKFQIEETLQHKREVAKILGLTFIESGSGSESGSEFGNDADITLRDSAASASTARANPRRHRGEYMPNSSEILASTMKLKSAHEVASTMLQQMREELEELTRERDESQGQLAAVEARTEELQAELRMAQNKLTEGFAAMSTEQEKLRAEADAAQGRLEAAKHDATGREVRLMEANARVKEDLETKITMMVTEIATLVEERDRAMSDAQASREAIEEATEKAEVEAEAQREKMNAEEQFQFANMLSENAIVIADRDELETRLDEQEKRAVNAESKVEELNGQIEALEAEVYGLKSRLIDLEETLIKEKERAVAEIKAQMDAVEAELGAQITHLHGGMEAMERQKNNLETLLESTQQNQLEEKSRMASEHEIEVTELRNQMAIDIDQLHAELADAEGQKMELEAVHADLVAERDRLVSVFNSQLDQMKAEQGELEVAHSSALDQIVALETGLESAKANVAAGEDHISELKQMIADKNAVEERLNEHIERLVSDVAAKARHVTEIEDRLIELHDVTSERLARQQAAFHELQAEKDAKMEAHRVSLERQIVAVQSAADKQRQQAESHTAKLEKSLAEAEAEIKRLIESASMGASAADTVQRRIDQLTIRLCAEEEAHDAAVAAHRAEIEELTAQHEADFTQLSGDVARLQAELSDVQGQKSELEHAIGGKDNQIIEFKRIIASLSANQAGIEAKRKELQVQVSRLQAALQKQKNEATSQQLIDREVHATEIRNEVCARERAVESLNSALEDAHRKVSDLRDAHAAEKAEWMKAEAKAKSQAAAVSASAIAAVSTATSPMRPMTADADTYTDAEGVGVGLGVVVRVQVETSDFCMQTEPEAEAEAEAETQAHAQAQAQAQTQVQPNADGILKVVVEDYDPEPELNGLHTPYPYSHADLGIPDFHFQDDAVEYVNTNTMPHSPSMTSVSAEAEAQALLTGQDAHSQAQVYSEAHVRQAGQEALHERIMGLPEDLFAHDSAFVGQMLRRSHSIATSVVEARSRSQSQSIGAGMGMGMGVGSEAGSVSVVDDARVNARRSLGNAGGSVTSLSRNGRVNAIYSMRRSQSVTDVRGERGIGIGAGSNVDSGVVGRAKPKNRQRRQSFSEWLGGFRIGTLSKSRREREAEAEAEAKAKAVAVVEGVGKHQGEGEAKSGIHSHSKTMSLGMRASFRTMAQVMLLGVGLDYPGREDGFERGQHGQLQPQIAFAWKDKDKETGKAKSNEKRVSGGAGAGAGGARLPPLPKPKVAVTGAVTPPPQAPIQHTPAQSVSVSSGTPHATQPLNRVVQDLRYENEHRFRDSPSYGWREDAELERQTRQYEEDRSAQYGPREEEVMSESGSGSDGLAESASGASTPLPLRGHAVIGHL